MEEVIFRTLLEHTRDIESLSERRGNEQDTRYLTERIERLEGRVAALAEHFGVSFMYGPTVVKNEAAQ